MTLYASREEVRMTNHQVCMAHTIKEYNVIVNLQKIGTSNFSAPICYFFGKSHQIYMLYMECMRELMAEC